MKRLLLFPSKKKIEPIVEVSRSKIFSNLPSKIAVEQQVRCILAAAAHLIDTHIDIWQLILKILHALKNLKNKGF